MRRHKRLAAAGIGFLIFAAIFFLRERILMFAGDYLVIRDRLQSADVIQILAGPDYRTDYGIQLYLQGYGRKIFFAGGWCSHFNLYHGEHGKARAQAFGVPPEAIVADDSRVTSTYSEVVRLKELAAHRNLPIRSVIVVSDPYHMRRARWAYRNVFGNGITVQMAPVPFESSRYRHLWWTDARSRAMVTNEYLKFIYYYARYRLAWGLATEWLASLDRE